MNNNQQNLKSHLGKIVKGACLSLAMCTLASLIPTQSWAQLPDSVGIDEIVITGAREEIDLRHLPMSVSVISSELIENRQQESILSVLSESVPGLFVTSRGVMGYGVSTGGAGGIKMRGIGGWPTTGMLMLIDGTPQYMGLMGHPVSDIYQSWMAEKVEVVRNPASVLYGSNAMGGVINIITKQAKEDGVRTNADISYGSYNTLTTEITNSIRKNKFTSHISASYNSTDGHRENMDYEQYGGYAKLGYEFSDVWDVAADVNITRINASNPGMDTNPIYDNDSEITRGVSTLSVKNNYEKTSGAVTFYYNWGEHLINDGYYEGGTPKTYLFNSKDDMYGVSIYQSASLFDGNRVTVGFDYQSFGGSADNVYTDGSDSYHIVDKQADDVAAYVDFRQMIGSFMTVDLGYRFDHNSLSGDNSIPQLGVSFYPSQTGSLKLLAGKGFRNPTIKEMYMFGPQNPDLLAESLWNYEISWKQSVLKGRGSYEVNVFYIDGENMIELVPVDGVNTYINTGEVKNFGLELVADYMVSKSFSLFANYSYLDMKYAVIAAPKHKFYGGVNFTKGKFMATAGVQQVNGLYTSVSDDATTEEDFTLVNVTARYKINDYLTVYAKGENLLDQTYEINDGFPMPGATAMFGVSVGF